MDERRWQNTIALIAAIREAEQRAGMVSLDAFHLRDRPSGVSHPTEDEAKAMQSDLREMREVAARMAEREASS